MKGAQELLAFNRGVMSRLGLARVDLKRTAMSAETMVNWMPRVLGSMMLRPGLGYIKTLAGATRTIPFIFAADDTAIIEVGDEATTITISDTVLTRPAVTASITNGTFTSNITSWTDISSGSGSAAWSSPYGMSWGPPSDGCAGLTGDGTGIGGISQQVTVNQANTEHALRIVINHGPVTLRVGSTSTGAEYINDFSLGTGVHSIAFTPTGASFYVSFINQEPKLVLVDSVAVEGSGAVSLPSPWVEADLRSIRYDQSGDIVFVACDGYAPKKIARRSTRSWSIEDYVVDDGPFLLENTTSTTITPSGLTGNITLTSSAIGSTGIFRSTHVGALFRLTSAGQTVTDSFSAQNDFSSHVRVTGVGESRRFGITITGTFSATLTLQQSVDEGTSWQDVTTYTAAASTTYLDGLDNQIVWYRVGVKTGDYTSGTAAITLVYSSGSITGIVRVTAFTNTTTVTAEVLVALGGTAATEVWSEGAWSDYRGWPSSVRFHDGRLFWAGKDRFWGSVTDQYYTFDDEFEGDAGPISRSIGYGPVDRIRWMLSLNRLMAGTDGSEVSCRSSSFNEPLTPTNFTPKDSSTLGSANVQAIKIDSAGYFVQRNGKAITELAYDVAGEDFKPEDLTKVCPDITDPGVVSIGVQRKPDTRLHAVRSDGGVAVMVVDRLENVVCWVEVETDGEVQDVCVLPGTDEDAVYYVVKRTIEGSDAYYLERWAQESEARGAAVNKMADSFVYAAASASTITGLDHLEGEEVVAWGGGEYLGAFTVASGSITLASACTHRCAGLPYTARFKSTKLAYSFPNRSSLTLRKKIGALSLVLADTHPESLEFGPSFTTMDPMPLVERYAAVDPDAVWEALDAEPIEFPGEWDTDSRLCLRATAPKPCTVLACAIELETNR